MRNLPPENQTKPLNEANLENLIEEFELTAQNNLSVLIDMSQRINELAVQTRSMLHTLARLQLIYSLEKERNQEQIYPISPSDIYDNPCASDASDDVPF